MTVFHSVHWFFSLVQTALKKIIAWDAPFTPCYFSPYNLTHHWFYILRAVVDLFSLKNPWKLFHHEINYENIRAYLFLRETNNSLSQMSNLVIFFFLTLFELCVGFFPALACWNIVSMSSGATPGREFGQYSFRVICPSPVTRTCVSDIHNLLRPCRRTVWG